MKKALIITIGALLFCSFVYSQDELKGYWEELSPEEVPFKTVLVFNKTVPDIEGAVHMFQMFNEINKVSLKNLHFVNDSIFYEVPEMGIVFKGIIFWENATIEGVLTFSDGGSMNTSYQKSNKESYDLLVDKFVPKQDTSAYIYKMPEIMNDGWQSSSLVKENIDKEAVVEVVNDIRKGKYGAINSFVIVKNGKLVLDEYFYAYTKSDLHFLSSATKSISSLITGVAIDKGLIEGTGSYVFDFFPGLGKCKNSKNAGITLHDLLSMQLGFAEPANLFPVNDNLFEYALNRQIVNKPGEVFMYDNVAPNLLAGVIKQSTGQHMDEFAEETLFNSLEINFYDWEEGRQNGYPVCQGTLNLKPRDMAKLGYLVLNNGKWKNMQLISKTWISQLKARHAVVNANEGVFYGYLWWIADMESGEKTYEVIYAGGSGGQYMFVVPGLNVLVLFTGNNFNNYKEFELFDIMQNRLLKSLDIKI